MGIRSGSLSTWSSKMSKGNRVSVKGVGKTLCEIAELLHQINVKQQRDRNPPLEEDYTPPLKHRQRETRRPHDYERDEIEVMARSHKLKQYFSQNPRKEGEKRPVSLAYESRSSQSKDKKRSEGEMDSTQKYSGPSNLSTYVAAITIQKCNSAFRGLIALHQLIADWNVHGTMDIDLRGINYDGPFVLTVGPMVIDTRVCEPRLSTVGTMPVSTSAVDSDIPVVDAYGNLVEKGQKIKGELTGLEVISHSSLRGCFVVSSATQVLLEAQFCFLARGIKVISGLSEQCQAGFMLENVGIFDDGGNIDADINEKLQNVFMPTVLSETQTVLKDFVSQGLDSQAIQKKSNLFEESASFLVPLTSDVKDKKHNKNMSSESPAEGRGIMGEDCRTNLSRQTRNDKTLLMDLGTKLIGGLLEVNSFGKHLSRMSSNWKAGSLSKVDSFGQENLLDAELPVATNIVIITYISGSTSLPKVVVMTHGNVIALIVGVRTIILGLGSNNTYLASSPLALILELAAEVVMVAIGSTIGYGSPLTLIDTSNKNKKGTKGDAAMLGPTFMTVVPAI
eukprot:Gb_15212 [translate_table: standard]